MKQRRRMSRGVFDMPGGLGPGGGGGGGVSNHTGGGGGPGAHRKESAASTVIAEDFKSGKYP